MKRSISPPSLFWRVFLLNAGLMVVAVVALALTPATVSSPATTRQLATLAAGVVALLAANLVLLRVSLRPLSELEGLMQQVDLLRPGQRLEAAGARELAAVTAAFNEMLQRLELERQASTRLSVDSQEDERRQLAGELHDEVGQGLTALLLELRTVSEEASDGTGERLAEAQRLVRQTLDEVSRIARRLRPTVLDDLGLGSALENLADVVERSSDLVVERHIDHDAGRLTPETELALYRIAQEALTNVARHADATRVELTFGRNAAWVELRVTDDGRGMLYVRGLESGGIRGMRERALAAGAELELESRPGVGTVVSVAVRGRRSDVPAAPARERA
jgi:two-component system sensor histidine kinase UhpB